MIGRQNSEPLSLDVSRNYLHISLILKHLDVYSACLRKDVEESRDSHAIVFAVMLVFLIEGGIDF